jgi:hypothetical protein
MASPRRATDIPPAVKIVADSVQRQPREIAALTDTTIAELCKECGLKIIDRVAVESYVAAVRAEKATAADIAERAEQLKLYSWKEPEQRALRMIKKFNEDYTSAPDPFSALKATFESNSKAGLISAESSLVLSYVLYASDSTFGRYLLACLLLYVPTAERLPTHNWALAQQMDNGYKHAVGAAIEKLRQPLFPPNAAGAETLNAKLLRGEACSGGEGAEKTFSDEPLITGGGWLPMQQGTDGTYGVETAPLDAAIKTELDNFRKEMQQQLQRIGRINNRNDTRPTRERPGIRFNNQQQQYQQPQQQYYQKPPHYRGYQPRGGAQSGDLLDHLFSDQQPTSATAPTTQADSAPPTATSRPFSAPAPAHHGAQSRKRDF